MRFWRQQRRTEEWLAGYNYGRQDAARNITQYLERHEMEKWDATRQRAYGGVAQAYCDAAALADGYHPEWTVGR